jgi:hypothetical protein
MNSDEKKKQMDKNIKTYGSLFVTVLGILLIFGWGLVIGILLIGNKKENTKDEEKIEEIKQINSINSFTFNYTNGYAINSDIRYSVNCKENCVAKIKLKDVSDEDTQIIDVDDDFISELVSILNKYDVIKWDGFDKFANDVLDGDSFSLSIITKDDIKVHATGYMEWPDNYRIVKLELDDLFQKLII